MGGGLILGRGSVWGGSWGTAFGQAIYRRKYNYWRYAGWDVALEGEGDGLMSVE